MDGRSVAEAWGLVPHPEGGFYRETYRSAIGVTRPGGPAPGFEFGDFELA